MNATRFPTGWFAVPALVLSPLAASQCPVAIDLNPGPGFSRPAFYERAFGQEVYFALHTPTWGGELWKWSPATGVVLVADVKTGSGTSNPSAMTACCTAQGPRIFFTASGTGINREVWITDGTPGNASQVAEIRPGSSGSGPGSFVAVGNRVMFTANDGTIGSELWVSDGTNLGTMPVKNIRAGSLSSNPQDMVALHDLLLFTADDGSGRELWVTDGTDPGTLKLGALVPSLAGSFPYELERCGDVVFFAASDPATGAELWKTDGTPGGTTLVSSLLLSWSVSSPNQITCCGDRVFFSARMPGAGDLLHVSDGTSAGTYRVQNDVSDSVRSPRNITTSGNRVFFTGDYFSSGIELWVSDGTDAGTMLAVDVHPGVQSSAPQFLTAVGTGVCFSADDGTNGQEPWFSDGTGTQAGSFMLCDLNPSGHSSPHDLQIVGGQLWLLATEPSIGTEPHVLATPGASVEQLAVGGAPDYPSLATRDSAPPVLGTTVDVVADDGPAGHAGALFVGIPGPPAPPFPPLMQGGCDWVGLFAGTAISLAGTPTSSLSVPLALPNQPSLEGVPLRLQMVWYDFLATPAIQLSNGLHLVLGEAAPH